MRPASYFIFITILIAPVLIAQQLALPSTRAMPIDDPCDMNAGIQAALDAKLSP